MRRVGTGDSFVHARAEKFAALILSSGSEHHTRLDFACRQLFGRTATADEQTEATEFLRYYAATCGDRPIEKRPAFAWAAYARVLFGSNEFSHLD